MKTDRRVQRTRRAIHEGLMSLVANGSYDAITVQHILERANVGRSTFYSHFREKDDVLLASVDDLRLMLTAAQQAGKSPRTSHENVIAFSRAMFDHAAEYKKVYRTLVTAQVWPRVRQEIHNAIAELIRRDVRMLRVRASMPPDLLVHYLASTFMSVLTWWLENRASLAPSDVDRLYRELVLPTLRSVASA
jgi:AcrR family transcriptional regulator